MQLCRGGLACCSVLRSIPSALRFGLDVKPDSAHVWAPAPQPLFNQCNTQQLFSVAAGSQLLLAALR